MSDNFVNDLEKMLKDSGNGKMPWATEECKEHKWVPTIPDGFRCVHCDEKIRSKKSK
jgi:hypothetical protein